MTAADTLAIVGDVHGDGQRLQHALDTLLVRDLDIVFIGDYVNRGPDSRSVLSQLLQAKTIRGDRLTLLRGNHDQVLLDFFTRGDPAALVAHGGTATVRSYLEGSRGGFSDFRYSFPGEHWSLLEATVDYYQTDDLLVTHAGFNPNDIASRRPADVRGAGFQTMFDHPGPWPRPLTVCGHFVQRDGRPYVSEHLICIDTGCGTVLDAALTVMYWPSTKTESF